MADKVDTVSLTAIADLFGVDLESIRLWRTKGMPHRMMSGRPRFVVAECVRWRREQDKRETRESASPDEAKERARKLSADADLAELRVRQRRGELVAVVEVERQVDRIVATVRARVLAVRGRWAPRVIGLTTMQEATTILDGLATDILSTLSEGADELAADDETASEVAA